ncbi:MAG: Hsp20/alpha crystallin family protein [Myxococcales bacterium]
MAIMRHDPFRDLFQLQDHLFKTFDSAVRGGRSPEGEQGLTGTWTPLVDVFEDADGVTLKVELPEVEAADVDLHVEDNTLTLRGERKLEQTQTENGYQRIERAYGAFQRSFALPPTIDSEHISAESKDGVLRIRLPKRAETKPRQIKVQVDAARASQPAANVKQ